MTPAPPPDLIVATEGRLGRLRLNRPRAIHALTQEMCRAMTKALLGWRDDPAVDAVLIDHADGRGFCSGGDVVMVAASGGGDGSAGRGFFFDEYRLNHLLFTYPKPTVAVMDGVTMGGGVGIAQPCRFRVATENSRWAMPETTIALFPDVGGGWYLPRMPGRVGWFLALTGARLDGAECRHLGIATHFVPAAQRDELAARIARAPSRIRGALGALSASPPDARIAANLDKIERLFAGDTVEAIVAALEADGSAWAEKELATLAAKSPLSCKVTMRLLNAGARRCDFAEEMRVEYRIAARMMMSHDFREGVRALLVDKDGSPRWNPPTLADVPDSMVDALFAPLAPDDEWTPHPGLASEGAVS
jgi:enoyl-CoA hydratase